MEGRGVGWGAAEVKSASLSGSVSLVNHRPPFSSLSQQPSHSVFWRLCMYVFEVCPFVLRDCAEPVLNIDCACVRACVSERVCASAWGGGTEGVKGLM